MSTFTLIHVLISLVAIIAGFVVASGMLAARLSPGWTGIFLVTTIATSATGFFFPFHGFTPATGVGIVSLVVLAVALFALWVRHLAGAWRWIYVVTAMLAFYLNFFVLIAQTFQKVPALKTLAPTQSEPPFAVAQGVALLAFVFLGGLAVKRFHPRPPTEENYRGRETAGLPS